MNSLSTASLAIYAVLSLPVFYILVKHWRQGLLGWLFLFIFCTIRLIGGALSLNSVSSTGSLLSSVGLSPLLLATSGILHEARIYRIPYLNRKVEWIYILLFHLLVVAGVVMVAMGASDLQSKDPKPSDETIIKVGVSILTVSWLVLVAWSSATLVSNRHIKTAVAHREGTVLFNSVCFALGFVGVRVVYSLVAFITGAAYLNPVTGSIAARVLLGFLPELIATLAFIAAGIKTRNISAILHLNHQNHVDHDGNSRKHLRHGNVAFEL